MRSSTALLIGLAVTSIGLTGCARDPNRIGITNPRQPGPAVGRAVGGGVGAVGGNVAGGVVGFGEGVVSGTAASFNNSTRVVRRWRTETTADGRTIQVPEDIVVDQYGRPVDPPKSAPTAAPPKN